MAGAVPAIFGDLCPVFGPAEVRQRLERYSHEKCS